MKKRIARLRAALEEIPAEEAALLLAVGLVLGVFPVMGCPTVLCLGAALGLRLNVAALQALNQATSPLQLALLVPLERAGARLCGAGAVLPGGKLGAAAGHAVAGWACICVPAGLVLYGALLMAARTTRRAWPDPAGSR